MKKKPSAPSKAEAADLQKQLNEVWPKLGPFPYLRTLEVMLEMSSHVPADSRVPIADLFRLIRGELRERSTVTDAEHALLRIMREMPIDDQKQMLLTLLEVGLCMPAPDASAFVDHLNFTTLGTGGAR